MLTLAIIFILRVTFTAITVLLDSPPGFHLLYLVSQSFSICFAVFVNSFHVGARILLLKRFEIIDVVLKNRIDLALRFYMCNALCAFLNISILPFCYCVHIAFIFYNVVLREMWHSYTGA